jgi:hypothetical protein
MLAIGWLSLFGNLLPYHYYWSAFATGGVPSLVPPGWQGAWATFFPRFLSDKPVVFRPILILTPLLYVTSLVLAAKVYLEMNAKSVRDSATMMSQIGS